MKDTLVSHMKPLISPRRKNTITSLLEEGPPVAH
ncbi:hypothetical protein M8C21_000126 [Ambrosia artemisiifolia]|uniref:Uncharacterized protein n=1 Tax=Ambrosia artemisiifolia TaxID=4212 RepID=A0AAD5D2A7_AMBAR|nr:hypothetical protein M8C21_000126 [Ambrosia artemisiifolia]